MHVGDTIYEPYTCIDYRSKGDAEVQYKPRVNEKRRKETAEAKALGMTRKKYRKHMKKRSNNA